MKPKFCAAAASLLLVALAAIPVRAAETLTIDASAPAIEPQTGYFKMGTASNPEGHSITVNSQNLLLDGKPWLPVMGEFHYTRYPETEWRDELLKMKAGGIQVVSTYIFWIHHEEIEGQFDWSGRRDLREFVKLAGECGLKVVVRLGPWDHGEVRNGGIPEWAINKGYRLRSEDPPFLADVTKLYKQIAEQIKGELWKDGGPIIGCQVDNEFRGPASYLLHLKKIAMDSGIDVPFYTRTGWPNLSSPMPTGELLPLAGAYAEGFWDRQLTSMPGDEYWRTFIFEKAPSSGGIGTDSLGTTASSRAADFTMHPYFTCEMGGGMITSYHRRILIDPRDTLAGALTKLGSGGNLLGYYMYHGGVNPDAKTTITLNEMQSTRMTNYNDMPVKSYEFQAPLGEYGQVHENYHLLRRIHLFLGDFGSELAGMNVRMPDVEPKNKSDNQTLRWAVRGDGKSGYLFVSNYQRGASMPAHDGVQFKIKLAGGELTVPQTPANIPSDCSFFWPVNMNLGGAGLIYATAEPVCKIEDSGTQYYVFAQAARIPAEFVFDGVSASVEGTTGRIDTVNKQMRISGLPPGRGAAIKLKTASGGSVAIILLSDDDSLALWKGDFGGKERLVLSPADAIFDNGALRMVSSDPAMFMAKVFPAPAAVAAGGAPLEAKPDGLFARYIAQLSTFPPVAARLEQVRQAGPPREIKMGGQKAAEEPTDADFQEASVWDVRLPAGIDPSRDLLLRIHYLGDVARMTVGGKLVDDNFYNGNPFEFGLKRYAPADFQSGLQLQILPLRKDAPIFFADSAKPDFGDAASVCAIKSVEVVENLEVKLTAQ